MVVGCSRGAAPDDLRGVGVRAVDLDGRVGGQGGSVQLDVTAYRAEQHPTVVQIYDAGTVNFMLERLGDGAAFNEALADARAAGFAEEDPSSDLEGLDAAAKVRREASRRRTCSPTGSACLHASNSCTSSIRCWASPTTSTPT